MEYSYKTGIANADCIAIQYMCILAKEIRRKIL